MFILLTRVRWWGHTFCFLACEYVLCTGFEFSPVLRIVLCNAAFCQYLARVWRWRISLNHEGKQLHILVSSVWRAWVPNQWKIWSGLSLQVSTGVELGLCESWNLRSILQKIMSLRCCVPNCILFSIVVYYFLMHGSWEYMCLWMVFLGDCVVLGAVKLFSFFFLFTSESFHPL